LIDLGYLVLAFISSSYQELRFHKCENILNKLDSLEKVLQEQISARKTQTKNFDKNSPLEFPPSNFQSGNSSKNLENLLSRLNEATDNGGSQSGYASDSSTPVTPKGSSKHHENGKKLCFKFADKSHK